MARSRKLALAILAVVMLLALWQRARLDYNGAYLDESDYLFVGDLLHDGGKWATQTYMFSSDLPLHVLSFGDRHGGLVGARLVCALLGLLSLAFYFALVRRLSRSRAVAAVATLIVAVSAPHVFISKLAVYDIVCLTAFVAGLWALARAWTAKGGAAQLWTLAAPALLRTALLCKYVVALELPVLGLLVLVKKPRLAPMLALPAMIMTAWYAHAHWPALLLLHKTQIAGTD